jgi:hypothetical protein
MTPEQQKIVDSKLYTRQPESEPPVRSSDLFCGCVEFQKAQQSGTDNESYGRLISKSGDEWRIGCDLDSISYCPWCGKRVPQNHVMDAGANPRDVQVVLGHSHLDTTMGYVHAEPGRVVSPLA